jgi:cytochrome c biogenesis protein CcmG/thiol:disulfide interchange protein DsbE
MVRALAAGIAALALIGLLAVLPRHPAPVRPGALLPRISVQSLDGTTVALAPRRGHALLVDVFATWCPYCRFELNAIAADAARLRGAGIDVTLVDRDESPSVVSALVRSYGVATPVFVDDDPDAAWRLDARVIPTTILVDRTGVVRGVYNGPLSAQQLLAFSRNI